MSRCRLLNEHYRCHPVIARWFNEAFYNNSLDVLTDVTAFGKGQRGLVWIDVEGTRRARSVRERTQSRRG